MRMRGTVLVVDDHARPRRALATELRDAGFEVLEAADGSEAWRRFCERSPDAVITDMVMPRSDGLDLLGRIRERSDVPVILFTARGSVQSAASAFKAGADDFVSSPEMDVEDLVELVAKAVEGQRGADENPALEARLVGRSKPARRLRERITGLAPLRTPVLISGEPGTGRDTVARALHDFGATAGQRFTRVDAETCAPPMRIPESGALYLDGVDRLTTEAQSNFSAHLTRAEGSGFRSGARIFASTSESLLARVREERFDQTLGTILLRFSIELPPLRNIEEDLPVIANALTEALGTSIGRRIRLSASARDCLVAQRWPGNVRQLRQILERAIAFSRGRQIRREIIEELVAEQEENLASIRERYVVREREALLRAIEETGGNISQTAELLGRSRSAVYRLIEKHGIALARKP